MALSPGNSLNVNLGLQSEWADFSRFGSVVEVNTSQAESRRQKRNLIKDYDPSRRESSPARKKQKGMMDNTDSPPRPASPSSVQSNSPLESSGRFPDGLHPKLPSNGVTPYMMARFLDEAEYPPEGLSPSHLEQIGPIAPQNVSRRTLSRDTDSDPDFHPHCPSLTKRLYEGFEFEDEFQDFDENSPDDIDSEDDIHHTIDHASNVDEENPNNILCEFSQPCHMGPSPDGMHYRKVVSHFFGRNKASTKLFPDAVWVHYCRKHYQRARYRADQWPFTQCELLIESLSRMEEWGGVESFNIVLRRREILRVDQEENLGEFTGRNKKPMTNSAAKRPSNGRSLTSGRRLPRAVVAPVPAWLRRCAGPRKSFDEIRAIVCQTREYMEHMRDEEKALATAPDTRTDENGNNGANAGGGKKGVWVPARSGSKDIERHQNSRAKFPDIEILPTFKKWVVEAAVKQRAQGMLQTKTGKAKAKAKTEANTNDNQESPDAEKTTTSDERENVDIGRTGVNRGSSAKQRRRSDQSFVEMVTRVSYRGSVKKPSAPKRR
ncbi:hypothetical protein N7466_005629 [Penicillium verhagenii]|uniref:uncharacterized protein n=1 Tax=Penicillium verhagenii TaxID=1562060 RepID=UPI002545408C|nr:uncharacterized protein N7466_005629 [Penicillium verhagenii]KAJ5930136.1 hypothetical protein N7466_005629 [Penicillium verhagenii]